jgi:Zn-dependent protease with chaperone function
VVAAVFVAISLVVQSGVAGLSIGINKALAIGILSMDGLLAIGVALIQLVLGIALAVGAIYLALNILDRLTRGIDEFVELKKGNVAVALEMAGVIIAVSLIIQAGVQGITAAII